MKKYFILAAAALAFAACTNDEILPQAEVQQTVDDGAVRFDAYLNRGVTRAGQVGTLDLSVLQTEGFGVFGYYTNNELYSESSKPNFFYNQKVSGATWTYSPIKYWPNEFGSDAISDAQDKLTFFAYAPWVDVEPSTGLLKAQTGNSSGIVALTRNTASGDPFVKYFVDMEPAKRVDLCWGVAKENFTSSVVTGLNSIEAGKPYKDVSKPEVGSKIYFDFKHALASLNVQIDADIDQDAHGSNALHEKTKIFVRSVTFEGFASKGMFNLNAEQSAPKWYDLTGINELTNGKVTVYDGRRDGSEGQVNANASNETPKDLNPVIVQSYSASALSETAGVPSGSDPVNLFNSTTLTEPVYVIPTKEPLKVTIVYDVETEDENLAAYLSDGKTKGSSVENTITKSILISSANIAGHSVGDALTLEAGYSYTVKLHLGMTSVKFDAYVTEWTTGDTGEPWLPINNGSALTKSANIDADAVQCNYTFEGGSGNHSLVSITPAGPTLWSQSKDEAGVVKEIPANTSVNKIEYVAVINDAATPTPNELTLTIIQAPAALGLGVKDVSKSAGVYALAADVVTFELESSATGVDWTAATKELYNESDLKLTEGTHYNIASDGKTITILAPLPDDSSHPRTLKVKVKAGDADEEEIQVKLSKS